MVAGRRGRNIRKPTDDRRDGGSFWGGLAIAGSVPFLDFRRGGSSLAGGLNRDMRNSPGRCVSTSSGEPTLALPTSLAKRATVSSNFSGSGLLGTNKPLCAVRRREGSATRIIFTI